jgi:hypothetical protein
MPFKPATKKQARLRMALIGPSGSGKTYTALTLAVAFGKVAVIDTERGSASKYADKFTFDVLELANYDPREYVKAIGEAARAGYDVLVIDSLSHAWNASGGVLELVDKAVARSQSKNSFTAWRDVTPLHNQLVDAMLTAPLHIIVTMRAKTEYVLEQVERNGRRVTEPRKIGMAPVQRDGIEYEFDVVGDMDLENTFIVSKTRCSTLAGGAFNRPGDDLAGVLKAWLTDGEPLPEPSAWQLTEEWQRVFGWLIKAGLTWEQACERVSIGLTDVPLIYTPEKFVDAVKAAAAK